MIAVLSPAKKLDYDSPLTTAEYTQPQMMAESEALIKKLKKFSARKIGKMMDISPALSDLNYGRFQDWEADFSPENARQAILAFKGDVYLGMQAETFSQKQLDFAQEHVRILSGLHGLLRPLDLMRPYRLEMGTKFAVTPKKKNLYAYWGTKIADQLNADLAASGDNTLLNLASGEYFKAIDKKALKGQVINVNFKDLKNGEYKAIFLWVKQARGMMTSYMVKHGITDVQDLKSFDTGGYMFNAPMSSDTEWTFTRDKQS